MHCSLIFISGLLAMHVLADRENNGYLPKAYTCEGIGSFPHLTIKEIPLTAECLAIIVDDPDAPSGVWNHVLMANIPITASTMTITEQDFMHGLSGQNSRGDLGRGAPCPPHGLHRYFFRVYALRKTLLLSSGFSKEVLLEKIHGNIIAQAELIGLFEKGK